LVLIKLYYFTWNANRAVARVCQHQLSYLFNYYLPRLKLHTMVFRYRWLGLEKSRHYLHVKKPQKWTGGNNRKQYKQTSLPSTGTNLEATK